MPGVTATYLRDKYPLPPEAVWTVLRKDFDRAKLHPDNIHFEAVQPAMVESDQIYEIAYKELVEELRYDLSAGPDAQVPVYPFGYDWRHPVHVTEAELAAFVNDVIERTKITRHYFEDGYGDNPKVNLVGHSMGGLVVAGYVERFGGDKIGKVATLATPFNGSFEAIVKMATGTANIGGGTPSSREREAARVTPSLYNLLPSFDTGIELAPGTSLPRDTFNSDLWQPSIYRTIADYVARYGRDTSRDAADDGLRLFKSLLSAASDHRKRIDALDLEAKGLDPKKDWLCVVGVGTDTRTRMTVTDASGAPHFQLTKGDRMNKWKTGRSPQTRKATGDGTVHFEGAVPAFLDYHRLVCVTPDDYGYWELKDKATTKLAGFHGILPNMNMLHRLLVRFFKGAEDPRGNTWGRRAPGVSDDEWDPPLDLKDKSG